MDNKNINLSYYERNKEALLKYQKEYYLKNKDLILLKRKEPREQEQVKDEMKILCECNSYILKANITTHKKSFKHRKYMDRFN